MLRHRFVDCQRLLDPDAGGNGGGDQRLERLVAEQVEHGANVGVGRSDVTRNEARRLGGGKVVILVGHVVL